MQTYLIFIRGVMPTGKNKVPMALLRNELSAAGLADVRTYIQSGNVIAASDHSAADIERLVHDVILESFGGDLAIIAKTPAQVRSLLSKNPLPQEDTSRLYFTLLAAKPNAALLREFLTLDFGPDRVEIVGDVVYTLYATRMSDSKFNNNFYERRLKTSATTRNYNTMTKLLEISSRSA